MKWLVRNQRERGSILVLVLTILGISTLLFSVLVQLVVIANEQTTISKNMIRYRSVLDSMIDYMIYGIKQKWCFDTVMIPEACTFAHTASTERLVMSDNASRALGEIVQNIPTFAMPPFRITSMSRTVATSSLTGVHPLARAAAAAQGAAFTDFVFSARRITNRYVAQRGDEAMVRVKVTLNSSLPMFKGLTSLSVTSTIMVFPRELNQMSLVVPRDLNMDTTTENSPVGDVNLYRFPTPAAAGAGILFESPVFVNRNALIPAQSTAASPPYSPATFAGRLILGDGRVMRGGALMEPASPGGGPDRYYDQLSGIGGFLKGIEIDGLVDQGLEALTGTWTGVPPDPTAMGECVDYLKNKNDLLETKSSPLYAELVGANTGPAITFKLATGGNNAYSEQNTRSKIIKRSVALTPGDPATGGWGAFPTISNTDPAVGYVNITFGAAGPPALPSHYIKANLAWNSTINFAFRDTDGAPRTDDVMELSFTKNNRSGGNQPNEGLLTLRHVSGPGKFIPTPVRIYFKAYDYGTHTGADRRRKSVKPDADTLDPDALREANLQLDRLGTDFQVVNWNYIPLPADGSYSTQAAVDPGTCAGTLPLPTPVAGSFYKASACTGPGGIKTPPFSTFSDDPPDQTKNYEALETTCAALQSARGSAFGMAAWGTSFTGSTRVSWNFRPLDPDNPPLTFPGPVVPELTFTAATDNAYNVQSIVGRCRVDNTATAIHGLYVCDELIIDPRGAPLTINGTFIVGKTNIHRTALNAGIRWRSLRHPAATPDLRARGILLPHSYQPPPGPGGCDAQNIDTDFSPHVGIVDMVDQIMCNTNSLVSQADPFTWTTVDPDCGLDGTDSFIRCLRRPMRYFVREVSRIADM